MSVVLVVEPDLALAKLCRLALEQDGHEATCAIDGTGALLHISRVLPEVVVVDVEVLSNAAYFWRTFRDLDNRPLLVVIAPFDAPGIQERLGAEASLAKPFDPVELSRLVEELPRRWLSNRGHRSSSA